MSLRSTWFTTAAVPFLAMALAQMVYADIQLDQRAAKPGEWGYRPAEGSQSATNPPSFSWRPQKAIGTWEVQCRATGGASDSVYRAEVDGMNVHCPAKTFAAGEYVWRYRGTDSDGERTNWSRPRRFTIPAEAVEMPMPGREELMARIPKQHPRLFARPETVPALRKAAQGPMQSRFEELSRRCDEWLESPPPTEEPPKYPSGMVRNSDAWRKIWWGNRTYTIRALNAAATLGFTHLLGGREEYGELAKRILLDCAKWDPKGATGYRYNDEAGMPYNYYFARTYTFVHDLLSEEEREICRRVMKVRGDEMYDHLYPRHLWRPYSSHSNRAWHFLGEVGIAMLDEVEGAEDWVWFAMNVFFNTYPVWSDSDGGWHEGFAYWRSYINRFTWWADVMRVATDVDAYDKPYFSQLGYYPMYLLPPGKVGGGFGDLNADKKSAHARDLMSQLAVQAGNGHWQWYVNQLGGLQRERGYIGFVRGALPEVRPRSPKNLPSSRLFAGTGQAMLNTTIKDARDDVQILFKSSPFGTWSHGYEANNSFLLWAYGKRLLIRSGRRDSYGTDHHRKWMWSTRSVNNITVDGHGQLPHSQASRGRIVGFQTSPSIDYVVGEAASAYREQADGPSRLDRFTRAVLFVKPDLIVIFDRLAAREASRFEYWLHATEKFDVRDQRRVNLQVDDVHCDICFLAPANLEFTQTNQYDPNPRPRIKLREWHLTATTPEPRERIEFVTVMRPFRDGAPKPDDPTLELNNSRYKLIADVEDTKVTIELPVTSIDPSRDSNIVIARRREDGSLIERKEVACHDQGSVKK
ncbi:MAG: DUF4962 domain-containing protein [Pirellulaceae bacterium]